MSTLAKAPWQVAFAATTAIVVGVAYGVSALLDIVYSGDRLAVDARLDEYQSVAGLEAASADEIHEWMALSATVFAVVAAVFIILGVLLWQGVGRPGVRLTFTIAALVATVGSLVPLFLGTAKANAVTEDTVVFLLVVHVFALVGALLLWAKSVRGWVLEQP